MPTGPASPSLIAGQYDVDFAAPLPDAGGGLRAFAVTDRRGRKDLIAVETRPWWPPRAHALTALAGVDIDGLMTPLANGRARPLSGPAACYVVTQAPPGPSLAGAAGRPWSEGELIDNLLRPAVHALERLEQRGLTHRAIRPDNLFRAGPGQPVTLGQAWATPPTALQPPQFEPPYMAMCAPAARGDGRIADDVYALGVTMIALALGRIPLAGLDAAAIVRLKLERGAFGALAGEERLPGLIADLARGMLAEDPEHRPPLSLLADPATARTRRVAARPSRRGQRALDFAGSGIWDARTLAFAMTGNPPAAISALRDGSVERWLRRSLGDPALANRVLERTNAWAPEGNGNNDGPLLVQVVSALDPLAPIAWPGTPLWPDALGTTLAASYADAPARVASLHRFIETEAPRLWAGERADRCDVAMVRAEARQNHVAMRTRAGGGLRLLYALNPVLACGSPLLDGASVARVNELLPALEAVAGTSAAGGDALPIDEHIAAFAAARADEPVDRALLDRSPLGIATQLRLIARLQGRFHPTPLPGLTGWLGRHATLLFSTRRNKARRERAVAGFRAAAEAGLFAPMLAFVDDPGALQADADGVARAAQVIAVADAELRQLAQSGSARGEHARRLGQEIAAGSGLAALAAMLALAAFG